ncbi:phage tail protein [uncultured Megasphaera sp.]|uniref:phage tail protein n=1 Tax=uncultured Megasphaera sp. TaxID=165188 RepID=UPI00266D2EA5|nr:phage tail protein [uncultured Megasphaera sp.]
MINIDVRCEGATLAIQMMTNAPKRAKKIISMSVNKIARSARTQMAREDAQKYFITVGNARKTIKITKAAGGDDLQAKITSQGYPISLAHFKVSPKKVQHKGRKNKKIRVRVQRSGGGGTLDRAFIMAIGSGIGVFERDGKPRKPVSKLFGPSVPSMLKNEEIKQVLEESVSDKLNKELNRQLARIVEQ